MEDFKKWIHHESRDKNTPEFRKGVLRTISGIGRGCQIHKFLMFLRFGYCEQQREPPTGIRMMSEVCLEDLVERN